MRVENLPGETMSDIIAAMKRNLHNALRDLCDAGGKGRAGLAEALYHPDVHLRASHPMNESRGVDSLMATLWAPLFAALADVERRDLLVVGGQFEGRDYVGMVGHYCGTFRHEWLGIPATGRPIFLRYGEVHEVRDGKIVQSNCLWDVLDLIRQAGFWPLPPSLGTEGRWAGPITGDGLDFSARDAAQSAASIAQTLAMHGTLGAFNDPFAGRDALMNMPQRDHWHPRMMWYGPSGIGTTRGLQGFVEHHQMPFRAAFHKPTDAAGIAALKEETARIGGGHYIRVGDGPYSVTGGWPSRVDVHAGANFLGLPATGRTVGMRVMDFYLHDDGLIRENWVPLDILDLLNQLGVDVLARLQSHFRWGC